MVYREVKVNTCRAVDSSIQQVFERHACLNYWLIHYGAWVDVTLHIWTIYNLHEGKRKSRYKRIHQRERLLLTLAEIQEEVKLYCVPRYSNYCNRSEIFTSSILTQLQLNYVILTAAVIRYFQDKFDWRLKGKLKKQWKECNLASWKPNDKISIPMPFIELLQRKLAARRFNAKLLISVVRDRDE